MREFVVAPIGELHTVGNSRQQKRGAGMSESTALKNAGMFVRDGKVAEVGAADDILLTHKTAHVIAARRKLITPGFVDCHTHCVWAGDRAGEFIRRSRGETYQEIVAAGGGIIETSEKTKAASVNELAEGMAKRANEMLANGTTSLEVKASYGLSLEGCTKELDAIAQVRIKQRLTATFMGAHAIPKNHSRAEFIELVCDDLIPLAAEHAAKPKFNDVFCEEGAFTPSESETILLRGLEFGLLPKIHSDEFNALGGTEMACSLGAVSCDHLLVTSDTGISALAKSHTIATFLPATAFYLDKPFADARRFIDAGCAVALGTDFNPGTSMVCSMTFVFGLAVSRMGMTPEEALCAATLNAASAIRSHAGGLTPGSAADFCIWDCETLEQLAYEFAFRRPSAVYIGGELAQQE